jgi:hypothetical protein
VDPGGVHLGTTQRLQVTGERHLAAVRPGRVAVSWSRAGVTQRLHVTGERHLAAARPGTVAVSRRRDPEGLQCHGGATGKGRSVIV